MYVQPNQRVVRPVRLFFEFLLIKEFQEYRRQEWQWFLQTNFMYSKRVEIENKTRPAIDRDICETVCQLKPEQVEKS